MDASLKAMINEICDEHSEELTFWESTFIDDIMNESSLTDNQINKLEEIHSRYCEKGPKF